MCVHSAGCVVRAGLTPVNQPVNQLFSGEFLVFVLSTKIVSAVGFDCAEANLVREAPRAVFKKTADSSFSSTSSTQSFAKSSGSKIEVPFDCCSQIPSHSEPTSRISGSSSSSLS